MWEVKLRINETVKTLYVKAETYHAAAFTAHRLAREDEPDDSLCVLISCAPARTAKTT